MSSSKTPDSSGASSGREARPPARREGTIGAVTDGVLAIQLETVDVAHDTPVHEDRFCHNSRVTENLRPVCVESAFVACVRDGHAVGLGVQLKLKQGGEIARLDVTQLHRR